jgi:GNAT superfamily N-acetyltransferase
VTVDVRPIRARADDLVADYVRIRNTVSPDDADSAEQVAWEDATYPGQVWRWLAGLDGETVGTCTTGRLHIHGPDHPRFYLGLWVLPDRRGRGAGSALYQTASEAARAAGKSGFQTWVSEDEADGVRFLLARGFTITGRDKVVSLDLRAIDPPAHRLPAGIELVTLAQRPDLVPGVHAAAGEAFPSIPSTAPILPGSLDEFTAVEVEGVGMAEDAFFVALDEPTGEVAGYANLKLAQGGAPFAYHHMTAVRPAHRGRGVATALKRATIAWAIRAGLEELRTGNDEANGPMRAVNARLGYRPRADYLALRGPLAPEPAGPGA